MDTATLDPTLKAILNRLPPQNRQRLLHIIDAYPGVHFARLPGSIQAEVQALLRSTASPSETRAHPALPKAGARNGYINGTRARLQQRDPSTLSSTIGMDIKTGKPVSISQKARQQGLYVIGATGTGKTTFLANLILSDIKQGLGVMLVEPHGDLTRAVIAGIPDKRLNDVIYLDMTDALHPFSISLFECADTTNLSEVAKVASFVMHLFELIWDLGTHTPLLAQVIRNVTRTCIEAGLTFADIPLLFWDDAVREKIVKQVKNTHTQLFWQQYSRKSPRDRTEFLSSTTNKIDAYLNEPMIAHIVSQPHSTISLRRCMDEGRIVLVNMSPQLEEMSRLLGALLIGKLLMAAYSRVDIPEAQRRQFNLYVDEFEKFCTDDFSVLIAEARKFRVAIGALANQTLEQLNDANRAAVLQSGSIICLRVSGEDARVLSQSFNTTPTSNPYVIGEEAVRAPTNDAINFLLRKAHTNPAAMACNHYLEYLLRFADFHVPLPPVHTPRDHYPNPRGSKAESVLEGIGDAFAVLLCNAFDKRKYRNAQGLVVQAQNCILLLNEYFAEVMRRGDPTLPIPAEVITLFGQKPFLNCERLTRSPALLSLLGSVEFAKAHFSFEKVKEAGYWGRHNARYMQLCEFLASLWTVVLTLAKAPILVETGQYRPRLQNRTYSDMEGEISNYLANQENYHARVKLLTSEYIIKTYPLLQQPSESEIEKRITAIKQRMVFFGICKPYRQVEREIQLRQSQLREQAAAANTPPPAHSRANRRGRIKPPTVHT